MNEEILIDSRIDITADFSVTAIPKLEGENETLLKGLANESVKVTKALDYGEIEVVVSNSGLDRHGERIIMEGIDLSQIKRNPVVLWSHQYDSLPIGRITKLWKKEGNLMAKIKLDTDVYDFADTVYKLIVKGTINAVSIGGIVREFGKSKNDETDYWTIAKLEMIELSVVPVGAHPDALVTAKTVNKGVDELKAEYNEFVRTSLVDKLKTMPYDTISSSINALKSLVSALESEYRDSEETVDDKPKETGVTSIKRKKLVFTLKAAQQCDRASELIIAAVKNKLDEQRRDNSN